MQPNLNLPTTLVIFGGTGDLATHKLIPALWSLYQQNKLTEDLLIIGLSRRPWSDTEYRDFITKAVLNSSPKETATQQKLLQNFCQHFQFISGDFTDPKTYKNIKTKLKEFEKNCPTSKSNQLFYIAVPPKNYSVIFAQLHQNQVLKPDKKIDGHSWSRLLVEKPFGRDLKTSRRLEKELQNYFSEDQIYRIDHYLAKDSIENIIALRFENTIFTDSWNSRAIESIHLKLFETKNVSTRGDFYDETGTLRDVGQNHLLQIFSLLTMPAVDIFDTVAVHQSRAQALKNLQKYKNISLTRGQYKGYLETIGVKANSDTETYFCLNFSLNNPNWKDTQFTLEAGKALKESINEAIITFRSQQTCTCGINHKKHHHKNIIRIQFSPKQVISVKLWTRKPGFEFSLHDQDLILTKSAEDSFYSPEAYEHVLYDALLGDQTRFVSSEEIDLAWQFITPLLKKFKKQPLIIYPQGSDGPITVTPSETKK